MFSAASVPRVHILLVVLFFFPLKALPNSFPFSRADSLFVSQKKILKQSLEGGQI